MIPSNALIPEFEPPSGWKRESYPTMDRDWLKASYISVPMGVAASVLVADSLEKDTDDVVYPIAVTTDINMVVDQRHYEIFTVANSPNETREKLDSVLSELSREFSRGNSDFPCPAINRTVEMSLDVYSTNK